MPTVDETWNAYLVVAQGLQPNPTVPQPLGPIRGRFIKVLVQKVTQFWERHKTTLIPYLTQLAIAAIEALVANSGAFDNVNPPGPD